MKNSAVGKRPRKKLQVRRIASLTELGEWTGHTRQWVARKAKEFELKGNNLNLRFLPDVLNFVVFLDKEAQRKR